MKELEPWARPAGEMAGEAFPEMLKFLGEEGSRRPKPIDIVFRRDLGGHGEAAVQRGSRGMAKLAEVHSPGLRGRRIYLSPRLTNSPAEFQAVLMHELTHVAQDYKEGWFARAKTPMHWEEGLADYLVCTSWGILMGS